MCWRSGTARRNGYLNRLYSPIGISSVSNDCRDQAPTQDRRRRPGFRPGQLPAACHRDAVFTSTTAIRHRLRRISSRSGSCPPPRPRTRIRPPLGMLTSGRQSVSRSKTGFVTGFRNDSDARWNDRALSTATRPPGRRLAAARSGIALSDIAAYTASKRPSAASGRVASVRTTYVVPPGRRDRLGRSPCHSAAVVSVDHIENSPTRPVELAFPSSVLG